MSEVQGYRLLILRKFEEYVNECEELSCKDIVASILKNMGCDNGTFKWVLEQDDEKLYIAINKSLTTERDEQVSEEYFKKFLQRNT